MSWNGTVRCRYCHNEGHNVKGCPDRKTFVKKHQGQDTWEGTRANALYERYDVNKNRKARTCKWCRETGHDIRKCPDIKERVSALAEKCLDARVLIQERMLDHEFGVGSLVKYRWAKTWSEELKRYTYQYALGLVEEVEWDVITHHHLRDQARVYSPYSSQAVRISPVSIPSSVSKWVALPVEIAGWSSAEQEHKSPRAELVSPSAVSIPVSFLDPVQIQSQMRMRFLIDNGLKK